MNRASAREAKRDCSLEGDTPNLLPVRIFPNAHELGEVLADELCDLVTMRREQREACVLGLPTGRSPASLGMP
jgi:hypothetical protein